MEFHKFGGLLEVEICGEVLEFRNPPSGLSCIDLDKDEAQELLHFLDYCEDYIESESTSSQRQAVKSHIFNVDSNIHRVNLIQLILWEDPMAEYRDNLAVEMRRAFIDHMDPDTITEDEMHCKIWFPQSMWTDEKLISLLNFQPVATEQPKEQV